MNTNRLRHITLAAALLMTINSYAGDISGNVSVNLVPALTNQVKRVVLYPDGRGPDEALVCVDVSGDGSFALEAPAGVNVRVSAFLDRNGDGLFSQNINELVSAPSGINLEDPQVIAEKRPGQSPVSVFYEVMHRFPGIEYIRLPLHPGTSGQQAEGCSGFHSDPRAYLTEFVVPIVRAAEREGVYVILSGHWVADYSSGLIASEVMPFVHSVAEVFGDNPAIILEPFNESINTSDTSWGEYRNVVAQPLVDYYRVCGGQGLVLVGAPFWNRLFDGADTNPVADPLNKTAYSMHIYPAHFSDVESFDAQYGHLLDSLPFMVTEWGFSDSGDAHLIGDVESYAEPFINYLDAHGVPHSAWLYSSSWQPAMLNADKALSEFGLFVQGRLCDAGTLPQDDVVFVEGVVNDKFLTPAYARDLPHFVTLHRVGDTPAEGGAMSQVESDGAFILWADAVAEDETYAVSVFVDSNNSGAYEIGELFITSPENFGRGFHGGYEILFSSCEWQSLGRAFGTENYGYNAIANLVDGDIAVGTVLDEAPGYFGTIPNGYNPVSLGGVRFKSLPWTYGVNPITSFSVDCMQNGVWVEVASFLEAGPDMWNTALFDGLILAQAVRVRYLAAMYAPTVAEIQILAQAPSAGGYDLWSSLLASDQQSEIATPAEDGIPNFIKYTCGLNPLVSSVTSEYMNITNRNNGCFEVFYYVDPTVEDAEVKPLFSTDLKTWYPVNPSLKHYYGVEGFREKYLISIPHHKRGFIKLAAQYISY